MTRVKRVYDVLLAVEVTKVVRVRAHSMKEAATVIYEKIPDEDQLGGEFGSEHIGQERVIDVVRSGDAWHADRKQADHDQ